MATPPKKPATRTAGKAAPKAAKPRAAKPRTARPKAAKPAPEPEAASADEPDPRVTADGYSFAAE